MPVQALGYKLGVVSTGNSLDHVEADDAQMAANGTYVYLVCGDTTSPSPHESLLPPTSPTPTPPNLWTAPPPPDASVKDMEAAAVAWAAELYEVPYFALKVVTDIGALMQCVLCVRFLFMCFVAGGCEGSDRPSAPLV